MTTPSTNRESPLTVRTSSPTTVGGSNNSPPNLKAKTPKNIDNIASTSLGGTAGDHKRASSGWLAGTWNSLTGKATAFVVNRLVKDDTPNMIKDRNLVEKIGYFDNGNFISCTSIIRGIAEIAAPLAHQSDNIFIKSLVGQLGDNLTTFVEKFLITAVANIHQVTPISKDADGREIPHTLTDILNQSIKILNAPYERNKSSLESAEKALREARQALSDAAKDQTNDLAPLTLTLNNCEAERAKIISLIVAPLMKVAFPNEGKDLTGLNSLVWPKINNPALIVMLYDLIMGAPSDANQATAPIEFLSRDVINIVRGKLSENPKGAETAAEVKERSSLEGDSKYANAEADGKENSRDPQKSELSRQPDPLTTLADTVADSVRSWAISTSIAALKIPDHILEIGLQLYSSKKRSFELHNFNAFNEYCNNHPDKEDALKAYCQSWNQRQESWSKPRTFVKLFIADLAANKNPMAEMLWNLVASRVHTVASQAITNLSIRDKLSHPTNPLSDAAVNLVSIFSKFYKDFGLRLKKEWDTHPKTKPEIDQWISEVFGELADSLFNAMGIASIVKESQVKDIKEKLPQRLYNGYSALIKENPHFADWLVPDNEHSKLQEGLRFSLEGETAVAFSSGISKIIEGQMDAIAAEAAIDARETAEIKEAAAQPLNEASTKAIKAIQTAILKNMKTLLPLFAENGSKEIAHLISALMAYGLSDTQDGSTNLKKFIQKHLEITLMQLMASFPVPTIPPQKVSIRSATSPEVVSAQPLSADAMSMSLVAVQQPTVSFGFITQCSTTILRDFKRREFELRQMHKQISSNPPVTDIQKELLLIDNFGALADDLLGELKLFNQTKFAAFHLDHIIRSQLINSLYILYTLLNQVDIGYENTKGRIVESFHFEQFEQEDKELNELLRKIGTLANARNESDLKEKRTLSDSIKQRKQELRLASGAVTAHQTLDDISAGGISLFVRNQIQSFLTNRDTPSITIDQIETLFHLKLSPDQRSFLQLGIDAFAADKNSPEWQYAQRLIHTVFLKIFVNYLNSSKPNHDQGMGLGLQPGVQQAQAPAISPLQTLLVDLEKRICTTVYNNLDKRSIGLELIREREARAEVQSHENAYQQNKREYELAQKSDNSQRLAAAKGLYDAAQTNLTAKKGTAKYIHKQFVSLFLPTVKAVFDDFGRDLTDPNHPLFDIPLTTALKQSIWNEKAPLLVADWIANIYFELHRENPEELRKQLLLTQYSLHAKELCSLLGKMTRDKIPQLLDSNSVDISRNTFEFIEQMLGAAEQSSARDSSVQALRDNRSAIEGVLQRNLTTLGIEGTLRQGQPDRRDEITRHLWGTVGDATEELLLKLTLMMATSFKTIDKSAPRFMQDFITNTALPTIARHMQRVNLAVKACGRKNLRSVQTSDFDRLKTAFIANNGELHSALRPIVLSQVEITGLNPQQIVSLTREREEQQRMEHLYRPLVQRFMEFIRLKNKDLPGSELTLKQLEAHGPKMVKMLYEKMCSPNLTNSIIISMADMMGNLLSKIELPKSSDSQIKPNSPESIISEEERKLQESEIAVWDDLMGQMTSALPGFLSAILEIRTSDGIALQNLQNPMLHNVTKTFFSQNPLTRIVKERILKPTIENMHPGECRDDGEFMAKGIIQFPAMTDQQAKDGIILDKNHTEIRTKEAIKAASHVVNLAIEKNAIRPGNTIFEFTVNKITRVTDIIFCCCFSPVKRLVRYLIEKIILGLIRKGLQFCLHPFVSIFKLIHESYVAWQVPLAYQNLRHPINENLVIQLLFSWLEQSIEQLKIIERDQATKAIEDARIEQEVRSRPPSPVLPPRSIEAAKAIEDARIEQQARSRPSSSVLPKKEFIERKSSEPSNPVDDGGA